MLNTLGGIAAVASYIPAKYPAYAYLVYKGLRRMSGNGFTILGKRRRDPTDDYRTRVRYQRFMQRHGGRTPNSVIGNFMMARRNRRVILPRLARLAAVNRNRTQALRRIGAATTIQRVYRGHRGRERARIRAGARRFYANAKKLSRK